MMIKDEETAVEELLHHLNNLRDDVQDAEDRYFEAYFAFENKYPVLGPITKSQHTMQTLINPLIKEVYKPSILQQLSMQPFDSDSDSITFPIVKKVD